MKRTLLFFNFNRLKICGLITILLTSISASSQFLSSAPSLTSTPTDASFGSYGNASPWFMGWDDTYLYIGKTGGNAAEPIFIFLDIDPVTPASGGVSAALNTNGNLVGSTDYGVTATLPFRADLRIVITPNYLSYATRNNSGGWNTEVNISTNNVGSSGGSVRTARIPWTSGGLLSGRPVAFNFIGYAAYSTGIYDVTPVGIVGNPSGNGASPRFYFYQSVSNTNSTGTSNPFSSNQTSFETREAATFSYTSSQPAALYDFNLNSNSATVNMQTNLTVRNNLVINTGILNATGTRTLTMSATSGTGIVQINSYGSTSDRGRLYGTDNGLSNDINMVISNGTVTWTGNNGALDNDDDHKVLNMTVNSGATLALSRGILCKYGAFTVNGNLQINANGYIQSGVSNSKAASYSSGNLIYNNGGPYTSTNFEWPTTSAPTNVTIQNTNTAVTLNGSKTISGILTISNGSLTTGANNLSLGTSASAIIGANSVLNITGGVTDFNNRPVTLLSTSITNGGAIGNISSTLSNATNVTVQRYTQAQRGYRTLGNPLNANLALTQLTDNFRITGLSSGATGYGTSSGNPSAFVYNGAANGSTNPLTKIIDATAQSWTKGKGLYVFIRGNANEGSGGSGIANYGSGINPVIIDVNGTINQGQVDVSVDYSGTPSTTDPNLNYNLIANPYPCPINLKNVVMSDNSSLYSSFGTIYIYNPLNSAVDAYTSAGGFHSISTASNPDIIIPTMGAFYVQTTTSAKTIKFLESAKITGTTPNYATFGINGTYPKIRLNVSNGVTVSDDIQIGIDKTSTNNAGDFYDGYKLSNTSLDFYSLSADKKRLAVDYRGNFNSTIPLGIQTNLANTYTISLSELTDLPNTQLVLKDKLLKTETILSQVGDSYSFSITADTATKGENRFEIGLLGTTVLPVQLADITAQLQANKTVAVSWTSTSEVNLASYKVQRSKDGSNFSTVGTVAAKGASTYTYNDDLSTAGVLPSTIYYRLEAVDKDGSKTYSKVVSCQLSVASKSISIYPNPVQATLFAQVTVTKAGAVQLRVIDAQGKVVATQKTQLSQGTTSVSIPAAQLTAGNYVLEIDSADGKQTQRFVKE